MLIKFIPKLITNFIVQKAVVHQLPVVHPRLVCKTILKQISHAIARTWDIIMAGCLEIGWQFLTVVKMLR